MPGKDPVCELLLRQTHESLRAMKLHIVNYQLQLLQASVRKPVENSHEPHANERGNGMEKTSRCVPPRKPRD
jgi:hypothetical protein